MPEIKIKHVVSFSSEDKVHKAENIMKSETYRKWKCASPGEKNASIVLQFEKATQIHSIDIGNECSAFVEVLVGRSSDSVNQFQVLLMASSFMSPLESRNENHNNRVRMFGSDKLAQNLKDEKWDCVQIVCTQPFNKNITYGLSFIKFHSQPKKQSSESEVKNATVKLGAFKLKYDDEDDDSSSLPSSSSWFQRKNQISDSSLTSNKETPSYAAAVLASSIDSSQSQAKESLADAAKSLAIPVKKEARTTLSSSLQEKIQRMAKKEQMAKGNSLKRTSDMNTAELGNPPSKNIKVSLQSAQNSPSVSKATISNKHGKMDKKPFHKIMNGVVFVISGFVNPLRGEIRDKALELGAKYKGDWDRSCTHLVCAFVNTPKYIQVRSDGGRIVTKDWIMDCHRKKVLLPWRSYMLGKYSKDDTSEEESEIEEEIPRSKAKKVGPKLNGTQFKIQNNTSKPKSKFASSDSDSAEERSTSVKNDKVSTQKKDTGTTKKVPVEESGPSSVTKNDSETEDEDAIKDYIADTDVDSDSEGDTEDEIRKVEERAQRKATQRLENVPIDLHADDDDTTDDDLSLLPSKPNTADLPMPELPNLFKKRHFYLYGDFSSKKNHDLQRYITAYNGILEDYMSDTVKYVITEVKWDEHFEEALNENEDLIFVRPEWIFKCHETGKLVPYQAHIVIPNS